MAEDLNTVARSMLKQNHKNVIRLNTDIHDLRTEMEAAFVAMDPDEPCQMSLAQRARQLKELMEALYLALAHEVVGTSEPGQSIAALYLYKDYKDGV